MVKAANAYYMCASKTAIIWTDENNIKLFYYFFCEIDSLRIN